MLTSLKAFVTNPKVVYFTAGAVSVVGARLVAKGVAKLTAEVKKQLAEEKAIKAAYEADHPTPESGDQVSQDTPENGPQADAQQ